jgi:hypothetical protein
MSMPEKNPIEEIWRIRDEIGAEHQYDVDRLFAALRERETQFGKKTVHHVERGESSSVLRDGPREKQ